MKYAAIIAVALLAGACDDTEKDPPALAARKAECRKVIDHIISLTPDHGEIKTPVEDVEQCGAAYTESVACMGAAKDLAGVHDCIPVAIECKDGVAEVTGTRPVFEVACDTVHVTASNAAVLIKAAKTIDVTGNGDKIDLKVEEGAKAPPVVDKGTGNTIRTIK